MNVYVVTADTYNGGWGAEIYIFAVCDTMEKALEEQKKVKGYSKITEMKINDFKPEYLGGYVE